MDINLFREANSFPRAGYEEQIMSKDKYPSIFLPQMEAIVFIILEIFFATCTVLKIGENTMCSGIFLTKFEVFG